MMGYSSSSSFFVLKKWHFFVPLTPLLSSAYIPKCSTQSKRCLSSPIIHFSENCATCLMFPFRLRTVCLPLRAAIFIWFKVAHPLDAVCFWSCFQAARKKSLDSSVCWPVRYLSILPLLLSLLLSIHLSLCRLTSGGDVRIKWPVNSCIPPSNYPVIQWDVLVEEIFSKGVWLIRRQRLILSSCVSACPSSSSSSIQLSIDVLRTHRSRWSSWGGLCRSWLWSPVCLSPSPELPNTPESPLRRPAVAQLIVGRRGEKIWHNLLKHYYMYFVYEYINHFNG